MQYIFILGNTPKLSSLEIKSSLENFETVKEIENVLIGELPENINAKETMETLGGTIKIASLLGEGNLNDLTSWQTWMPSILNNFEFKNSKVRFGFSIYSLGKNISNKQLKTLKNNFKKIGLDYKRQLKANDIRAELIESKDLALSSVIVNKEQCLDILVLIDKEKIYYAYTLAVQPYKDFSDRDYGRPNRDAQSGMLPPKVARMMVNISQGNKNQILLDAFCGSGTILQEALLLGYKNVIGSDISDKAINDTKKNLEYLNFKNFNLFNVDARNLGQYLDPNSISNIVSEVYLGPPNINEKEITYTIEELSKLYEAVFTKIKLLLTTPASLVIAFPAWRFNEKITSLPIKNNLLKLGYKIKTDPIIYGRPNAKVLREIYCLEN